jgi:hypothetical protein
MTEHILVLFVGLAIILVLAILIYKSAAFRLSPSPASANSARTSSNHSSSSATSFMTPASESALLHRAQKSQPRKANQISGRTCPIRLFQKVWVLAHTERRESWDWQKQLGSFLDFGRRTDFTVLLPMHLSSHSFEHYFPLTLRKVFLAKLRATRAADWMSVSSKRELISTEGPATE